MKLRYLICIILVICAVFLFACKAPDNNTDTDKNTDTSSDTQSDVNTDTQSSTDTNKDVNTDTDIDLDSNTDTGINTDTNIDTDTETDTQPSTDLEPDTEPEPEPMPVDVEITIFENGQSEYTIVYPKNNEIIESHVKELVSNISTKYGVTIPYKAVDKDMDVSDKEIVVGFVRNNVLYAASKMSIKDDFVLDVCDNDYVIYAPTDALYSYAFRVLEDEILSKAVDGTLKIKPENEFILKKVSIMVLHI